MLIEINFMPTLTAPKMTVENFVQKFLAAAVQCELIGERDLFFPPGNSSIWFNIKDGVVTFAVFNPKSNCHLTETVQNIFRSVGFQQVKGELVDGKVEYHRVEK